MSRFPLRFHDSIEITHPARVYAFNDRIPLRRQILMYKCLHSTTTKSYAFYVLTKIRGVSTELLHLLSNSVLTPKTLYALSVSYVGLPRTFMLLCTRTIPLKNLRSEDNNHRWLALYYLLHLHLHLHLPFLFITEYTRVTTQILFFESRLLYSVVSLFMG
jgi:hypothetical protein